MQRFKIYIAGLFTLLCAVQLSAQSGNAITVPYTIDFENPTENQNWVTDDAVGTDRCTDKWYIGSAPGAALDGANSLYISCDGGKTAEYCTERNIVVAYRLVELPAGNYNLSFDWKNLAPESSPQSGLYCVIYDLSSYDGELPESFPGSGDVNDAMYLVDQKQCTMADGTTMTCMKGSQEWLNAITNFTVQGNNSTMVIAFVWVNDERNEQAFPIAACVDNIQISSANCFVPTGLMVDGGCDSIGLSWTGSSMSYELQYRPADAEQWRSIKDIVETEYKLPPMDEGLYDFRVRAVCSEDMVSAWVSLYSELVFCPENHCIDYIDFYSPNVHFYEAEIADNAIGSYSELSAPIDYGTNEQASRHTVYWKRNEYDPRTQYKLKTIPDGEYASVRIGNWEAYEGHAYGDRIEYEYTVDPAKPILILKYAIVLQNPNDPTHQQKDQPYFELAVVDNSGNEINPDCGKVEFYADKNAEGWNSYWPDPNVQTEVIVWKDWTTMGLDLSEYTGNIRVRLTARDCLLGAHYGYAYFTLGCAEKELKNVSCGASDSVKLEAPAGFDYAWFLNARGEDGSDNIDWNDTVSHEQILGVEPSDVNEYVCVVSQTEKPGCSFQIRSTVSPREPYAGIGWRFVPKECTNIVQLINNSQVISFDSNGDTIYTGEPTETAYWDFFDGNPVYEERPTYVMPAEGGQLKVSLKAGIADDACVDDTTVIIDVPSILTPDTVIDTTICGGYSVQFAGQSYGETGIYYDSCVNRAGCDSVVILNLKVLDKIPDVDVVDTICFGETYYVGWREYTSGGVFEDIMITSANGCDSIVNLRLTVLEEVTFSYEVKDEVGLPNSGEIIIKDAPDGYTYSVNGEMGGPLTGLEGGIYKVVVFAGEGTHICQSDTAVIEVKKVCSTVEVDTDSSFHVCADVEKLSIPFDIVEGALSRIDVKYGDKAKSAGFEDISLDPGANAVDLFLPEAVRPDTYDASLDFIDPICDTISYPVTFDVYYAPGIVRQKWNNVLAVQNSGYNGGFDFSAFQWYKNGEPISGEVSSVLYLGEGVSFDINDVYHVLLTRADDEVSMPSCPVTLVQKEDISAYPQQTVVPAGAPLKIANVRSDVSVALYSVSGVLCYTGTVDTYSDQIVMPETVGVYVMVLKNGETEKHYKILVR